MAEALASNTSADGSIHVEFFEKPYRHYKINGEKVPSVTQAIGVVDKSRPLQFYAEKQTLLGVIKCAKKHGLDLKQVLGADDPLKHLQGELGSHKLRFFNRTDEAIGRGLDVHTIAENWLERQQIPNLRDYPRNRHGAIRAFAQWLMAAKPKLIDSEMVVGSKEHMYGGRLDMTIVITGDDGSTHLRDIKTSKAVYPRSHFPQLMGYEKARVEMGLPPTDTQGILLLNDTGIPRVAVLQKEAPHVTFEDFRVLLEAHRSQAAIPERVK